VRDKLFIFYSHKDEKWAKELITFLKPLVDESRVERWDDSFLFGPAGVDNLQAALSSAKVAVLLLSADFLASPLMCERDAASVLAAAAQNGTRLTWVVVSACAYTASPLMNYQAAFDPLTPLNALKSVRRSAALVEIAHRLMSLLYDDAWGADTGKRPNLLPVGDSGTSRAKPDVAPDLAATGTNHTFICYAREDAKFVLALASDLKAAGVNVWLDQWDIPSGADWDFEIDKALYDCRHFLIVLSPEAVNSEEVRSELRTALNGRKRIVPVLYKACRIPRRLTLIQYTDFTPAGGDRSAALKQIVRALGLKNP
jgi:hypothetical protein